VGEVLRVMRALTEEERTMIIVTHEMRFAREVSSKVLYFHEGLVEEEGPPEQVFGARIPSAAVSSSARPSTAETNEATNQGASYDHQPRLPHCLRRRAGPCRDVGQRRACASPPRAPTRRSTSSIPVGELQGFDVDIARALCEVMEVECEITAQAWDGIIPGLNAGRYDAIVASMSITPARLEAVNFTQPYYQAGAVLVAPVDSDIMPEPEAMAGRVIGVQRASTYANLIDQRFPRPACGFTIRWRTTTST
jgi:ABC-type amino acid transport substrate-binding protein